MTKLKSKMLYLSIILHLLVDFNSASDQQTFEDFETRKAMVTFNPYVSVLDQYNYERYGIAELIPLIEKVATRFNKIHIELSARDIDYQSSLGKTPFALGSYNCLLTTTNKVEVFLEFDLSEYELQEDKLNAFRELMSLADKANTACNGTVSSILVKEKPEFGTSYCPPTEEYIIHLKQEHNRQFNYSFGYYASDYNYCNVVSNCKQLNVDILLLKLEKRQEYLPNFTHLSCEPFNIIQNLTKPVKLITSYITSDIGNDSVVNMTRLVAKWRHTLTLPSDTYLISYAFDFFSYTLNRFESKGWWYLLKDSGNTNISEYVFEEKISVASKIDLEENPKNFQWLEQNHKFDENTTGIVSRLTTYPWPDVFKYFCRILNINDYFSESEIALESSEDLKHPLFLQTCLNFSVYHMPIFLMQESLPVQTLNDWFMNKNGPTNFSVYTLGDTSEIKYGYAFPLHLCGFYEHSSELSERFSNKINEPNIDKIMFYFYEHENLVALGATKLVRQRIVEFENCKKLVLFERKTNVEIAFASLGYSKNHRFSAFPVALQNYVKYTYSLENWAKNQTNTVVFLGQYKDVEFRLEDVYFKENNVVGWMSYDKSTGSAISKREEAFEISRLHYPKPTYITEIVKTVNITTRAGEANTLTGSQVFLVVGISVGVCVIIIAIVTVLICRHHKNIIITNLEIGLFLNGDDQNDSGAQKIPYEKEKYEISETNFKIESEYPLGAGEFGAVYRGTIQQSSGDLQVAVKTSNPQKFHKSQLTGLLSEIKVLAYIGKHEHITQLLGANTSSLKNGKVFIFLEFCHLGSLQKFLKEMRVLVSSPMQETNVDEVTTGNNYSNSSASAQSTLDDALSNDLYRWSTEICNGMAFLAEKHVVHADLATRNVLVNLRREAKICDFGLSRRMYNYTNYVKSQQEPLPWKWMAPESLRDMIFNEKTDVWAFGVTLWEIYSLASNPYAGLSWDANFSQMLDRGLRLSEPEYCERNMYEKMQQCWNICPDNRPCFSELLVMLQSSDDKEADV